MLKPEACKPCILYPLSHSFSRPDGQGTLGVVGIGEGLGHEEAIDGLPFRPHAQAGSQLEALFKLAGFTRQQFFLWNLVACQPPNNRLEGTRYGAKAINFCIEEHFKRVVGEFTPPGKTRTLLPMGNLPLKVLTGASGVATEKQSIAYLRGYVQPTAWGPAVCTYHPSYIRRGATDLIPAVIEDIRKAVDVASGAYTDYPSCKDYRQPNYQTHPSLDEAQSFLFRVKDNPRLTLVYDIETPESAGVDEDIRGGKEPEITQIQFSLGMREGIAFPWRDEYKGFAQRLLACPNEKAGHNTWNFDDPRIKANGIEIQGIPHDTMWMFRAHQPGLPRGLQAAVSLFRFPFAWKHLFGSQLEWYGCADVDAPHWLLHHLPPLMKARGTWEAYEAHLRQFSRIMIRAADRGIPVGVKEHKDLERVLRNRRDRLYNELQALVPAEVRNVKPRRGRVKDGNLSYGYLREPKQVKELKQKYEELKEVALGRGYPEADIASFDEFVENQTGLVRKEFHEDGKLVSRWCKLEPFKASKQQVTAYIEWKRGELERTGRE